MKHLRIALLQLLPGQTPEESLKKGLDACRQAKAQGADIALFPEMWSCGYHIPQDPDVLQAPVRSRRRPLCLRLRPAGQGTGHGHRRHAAGTI